MKQKKKNAHRDNKTYKDSVNNTKENAQRNSASSNEKKPSLLNQVKTWVIKVFTAVKDRIADIIHNIGDVLGFLVGKTGIGFEPGTKQERKTILKRIAIFLVGVSAAILIGFLVIPRIIEYDALGNSPTLKEGERLSFLGSFWGALLASIITLVGSIFTTWLIIQRSYKVDYHRERLENMPVLQMTLNMGLTKEMNSIKNELEFEEKADNYLYSDSIAYDPLDTIYLVIEIVNIGKGLAFQTSIPNSCENDDDIVFPTLCPNQKIEFLTSIGDVAEVSYEVHFFDMFENYYKQEIGLKLTIDEQKAYPIVKPPELVTKTKKIRYVQ